MGPGAVTLVWLEGYETQYIQYRFASAGEIVNACRLLIALTIAQDPVHTLRATSLASPGRNVNHHTCRQEHPRDFPSRVH
jgi:hypothetical protein